MIAGRFPRRASFRRTAQAIFLLSALSLTAPLAALANGGKGAPKGGERPVARLIGTVYSYAPARVTVRKVARASVSAASVAYSSSPSAASSTDERRVFAFVLVAH